MDQSLHVEERVITADVLSRRHQGQTGLRLAPGAVRASQGGGQGGGGARTLPPGGRAGGIPPIRKPPPGRRFA